MQTAESPTRVSPRLKWLLVGFGAAVVLYVLAFTDWIRPMPIEAVASVRTVVPKRLKGMQLGNTCPVAFSLNRTLRLTSLKVIEETTEPGNPPRVLWHLKSGFFGSWPTHAVIYGLPVGGMQPYGGAGKAAPLKTGAKYKLILEAGRRRGEVSFQTRDLPGKGGTAP